MHDIDRETNLVDRWDGYLSPAWIEALDQTPFLSRCRAGSVSKEELEVFLVQQYFYARHFTRYLCALLSNIADENDRRELTANLVDETGLGLEKGIPHSLLYRQMLARQKLNPESHAIYQDTQRLVETMLESCRHSNPAVGLGALCLGAEAIVPHIYRQIVRGFESQGYSKEELDFFYLHIGCDDEHALTMKKIIDREMQDIRQQRVIQSSAARIILMRARFFNALSGFEHSIPVRANFRQEFRHASL